MSGTVRYKSALDRTFSFFHCSLLAFRGAAIDNDAEETSRGIIENAFQHTRPVNSWALLARTVWTLVNPILRLSSPWAFCFDVRTMDANLQYSDRKYEFANRRHRTRPRAYSKAGAQGPRPRSRQSPERIRRRPARIRILALRNDQGKRLKDATLRIGA